MILERLKEKFGAEVHRDPSSVHGEDTVVITRAAAPKILGSLRDDPEFACEFLLDLTAVDWLTRQPRFDVVYHLRSMSRNHRLRVKVQVERRMHGFRARIRCGSRPTGSSANASTCSGSISKGIPICAASCSTTVSSAIRCARTIRSRSANRSCPKSIRSCNPIRSSK